MFKSLKLGYVPSALLQERIGKGAAWGIAPVALGLVPGQNSVQVRQKEVGKREGKQGEARSWRGWPRPSLPAGSGSSAGCHQVSCCMVYDPPLWGHENLGWCPVRPA